MNNNKSVNDKVTHGAVGLATRDIPMKYCSNSVFIGVLRATNLTEIDSKLANNWKTCGQELVKISRDKNTRHKLN